MANYQKALGMAQAEVKNAEWFKELNQEGRDFVLQQTKEYYTPPNAMENTLLNLAIMDWNKWVNYAKEAHPYYNGEAFGSGEVRLLKRQYFTNQYMRDRKAAC